MDNALAWLFLVWTMFLGLAVQAESQDIFRPDEAELGRLAALLPEKPGRLGPPAGDRSAWSSVADRAEARATLQAAEELLSRPLPELTDDLYLDYSRTGNRRRCEAVLGERRGRLATLALAECLEGKGRFLPKLEETILAICEEKSWVLPAHDGNLQNFEGKAVTIDLASSSLGWTLGMIEYLLGDRLSAPVREKMLAELERRIFVPFRRMCAGEQPQAWLTVRNNWNAVCLAGVTGAALAAIPEARRRAWHVLAAANYSRYSLEGFTPDGFCDEGVGYWNYGFGHYVALAETVRRGTGGQVDLMNKPEVVMPSAYGFRIEIVPGVVPAFADCDPRAVPSKAILDYLSRRFLGTPVLPERTAITGSLCERVAALFPEELPRLSPAKPWPEKDPLRTWFPDHSVFIGRPAEGSPCRLSVAFMGGHNAQNHNHNDVGTFVVLVDGKPVLPDIGAEVYTRRTFSAARYNSKALNSWGHPVPVIGGQLQRAGRQAEAKVLSTEFAGDVDRVAMEIRSAYGLPQTSRLERAFEYDRRGEGGFRVSDSFAFDEATTYETALLTFGTWKRLDDGSLEIADEGAAVRVEVQSTLGPPTEVRAEEVEEDLVARRKATRIGLIWAEPVREGTVTLIITPVPGR